MCTRIGGTFFPFPEGQLLCFFGISVHEISKKKSFHTFYRMFLMMMMMMMMMMFYHVLPTIRRIALYQASIWRLRFQFGFCPSMEQKS